MKIGEILKTSQPKTLKELNSGYQKREDEEEHLSYSDILDLMKNGHVYKRSKGGALRQVR